MIRKSDVRKFLARPRDDWRTYKKLSARKLEDMVDDLPIHPPIWSKLDHLQKTCFLIGAELRRFFFINDTGTGKTILSIALARYFWKLGLVKHVLVLVPNRINKDEWRSELQLHSPKSECLVLRGSTENKWRALENSNALFVMETYAGLSRMVSRLEKVKKKKGSKSKKENRLVPDRKMVQQLIDHFQGLICDESQNAKTYGRLPFRICRRLSKTVKILFLLTGTPFNREPEEMWAQFFLVDRGYTLGETLGLFREVFYTKKERYWGGFDYKFRKKNQKLLNTLIANASISYQADKDTLPQVYERKKYIPLSSDIETYVKRAKETLKASRGNVHETKNAFLRLRQISSGFVGFSDDETGAKARFEFPKNPKMEMLLSIIETIQPKHKVIIFYDFTYSGLRIVRELRDEFKIDALHMWGGSRKPEQIRDQFRSDPAKQILVLQNQFGVGLNVQVARYGIYYESPVSAIMRYQTRRRIERQYSQHGSVFLYDLIMRDTADEKILEFHKQGGDLMEALVRGKVTL